MVKIGASSALSLEFHQRAEARAEQTVRKMQQSLFKALLVQASSH